MINFFVKHFPLTTAAVRRYKIAKKFAKYEKAVARAELSDFSDVEFLIKLHEGSDDDNKNEHGVEAVVFMRSVIDPEIRAANLRDSTIIGADGETFDERLSYAVLNSSCSFIACGKLEECFGEVYAYLCFTAANTDAADEKVVAIISNTRRLLREGNWLHTPIVGRYEAPGDAGGWVMLEDFDTDSGPQV